MRLLNDEEIQGILRASFPDSFASRLGAENIAKAQQELTNKEWVEWIEGRQLKGEGSFSKTVLFQGDVEIKSKDLQARLKEIGNEPQV